MSESCSAPERTIRAVTDFIFAEDPPQPGDILFIPGSMTPEHAERAAELYRQGCAPLVLPSGRFSVTLGRTAPLSPAGQDRYPGHYETEWEFLRTVLERGGVPESALLREDRATYTWENALFSRQVTDEKGLVIKKALLCVMPWHARRALLYYQAAFPGTVIQVCPAQNTRITRDNWYLTQEGRDLVLGEVRRLGDQVRQQLDLILDRAAGPEKP